MAHRKLNWFQFTLQLRGSVVPAVLPRTIICGLFGTLITLLHVSGLPVSLPVLATITPNIVVGLMLVFRTNTAYERFWEGRRLWGGIIIAVRNLARQILVSIVERSPADFNHKKSALHLLVAFAVATKLHLRQQPIDGELEQLLSLSRYNKLRTMNNPPLEIAFWISDYLQQQRLQRNIDEHQHTAMQQLVNQLVEALSGCERILKTPIPAAYAIHLRQLLLIYCLSLPLLVVQGLGWWTGAVVAIVSFTLFGVEEIGIQIENPFGHDPNDLPLDAICQTMLRNIEDLLSLTSTTRMMDRTIEDVHPTEHLN
jgi:putative membrane protein